MMLKWLTSLILIAALASSVLAGMPLHHEKQGCSMSDMMECCQVAHTESDAPEALAAKLCCALNCSQPGATTPTSARRLPPLASISLHPAAMQSSMTVPRSALRPSVKIAYTANSPPAYIHHLALLI